MEQHAGALAGGADQPAERLVHLGHARDLVDAAERLLKRMNGEIDRRTEELRKGWDEWDVNWLDKLGDD